jgi:hypothetical protein
MITDSHQQNFDETREHDPIAIGFKLLTIYVDSL